MEKLVNQFFVEGIALDSQWTLQCQQLIPYEQRQQIIEKLQPKFASNIPLLQQLPQDEDDVIRLAFYEPSDNWFHQLFRHEGYNPKLCSIAIRKWLTGQINTLVLIGRSISTAKLLYNALSHCFPLAVHDEQINSFGSMAEIAGHASVYCIPNVNTEPSPLMLHLMEGNTASCWHRGKVTHIRSMTMLIHCIDISIAHKFLTRNTAIFFLTDELSEITACYAPRIELRDFVRGAIGKSCLLAMHCKIDNPMCVTCVETSNQ
ncbi:hypothetical protein ORF13 [Aviadenovirus bubonis]|nr:hypothetical protein ORF13 [Owl adenovirus]